MSIDTAVPSRPTTSMAAVASLICGILGCIPFATGLAAVILGVIGIKKMRDPFVTGRKIAIAGLVLGTLSLAGWTLGAASVVVGVYEIYRAAEPARAVAEQFTRDLSLGNVDAALASMTEGADRATLPPVVERMKPWGAFQKLGMNSVGVESTNSCTKFTIGGEAAFANEPRRYSITLDMVGETWKVSKFDFP